VELTRAIAPPLALLGAGARTPLGLSTATSVAAVRAGISAIREHPFMIDRNGDPMAVARARFLDLGLQAHARLAALALPAMEAALRSSTLPPIAAPQRIGVALGLPPPRPGRPKTMDDLLVAELLRKLHELGLRPAIELFASGHSGGLSALEYAARGLHAGEWDCCLVGGVDSYLDPETLEWLDEQDRLHGTANAWGRVPGEAAGFCLLARANPDRDPPGEILAVATMQDGRAGDPRAINLGEGLTAVIQRALTGSPDPAVKVDHIICDMNGEAHRADEFGFAVTRTAERFVDATAFVAPADLWGDVGAASGPLFLQLALTARPREQRARALTLICTSADNGERAAALVLGGSPRGGRRR